MTYRKGGHAPLLHRHLRQHALSYGARENSGTEDGKAASSRRTPKMMEEQESPRATQWTLRVGPGLLGVPVHLHWALLLLPVVLYLAEVYGYREANIEPAHGRILAVALVEALLLSIFIYFHEVGHALAARQIGLPVAEIVLHPLGGFARLAEPYRRPNHELAVSAAGPAVNLLLMAALWSLDQGFGLQARLARWTGSDLAPDLLRLAIWANAAWGLLNLLPLFPLDGSHMLRAFLSPRHGPARATSVTATVGQLVAVPLVLGGLYFGGLLGAYLLGLGVVGFFASYQHKLWARAAESYDGMAGDWGPENAGRWPGPTPRERAPGFWTRWREERRRRAAAQAAREEQEFDERVDGVLAKVKDEGLAALTRGERRLLQEASQRMRRRQEGKQVKR